LAEFARPEPVAIDLSGVDEISSDFVEAFVLPLVREPPSGPYGAHPLLVIGATAAVALVIQRTLPEHGCQILIHLR
jgi:hypothetical protein